MEELPSIELLKNTHHFPCAYMFKVIGRPDNGFVARVVAVVREELAIEIDPPYTFRQTAAGRHVSVTVEPHIQTVDQVLAVYRRLRLTEGLVMLM
jgi:putative lipoic acid-binding regulatory protein